MTKLRFRPLRITEIKRHLVKINNLLKDPKMSVENLQDLEQYFAFMAERTRKALGELVMKIKEEQNGQAES